VEHDRPEEGEDEEDADEGGLPGVGSQVVDEADPGEEEGEGGVMADLDASHYGDPPKGAGA
jgi:hypothetical protein